MPSAPTVDQIRAAFLGELEQADSPEQLQELRNRFLGRKRGTVTALLKSVSQAPPEARRELGRQANALKQEIERALAARREKATPPAPAPAASATPGSAGKGPAAGGGPGKATAAESPRLDATVVGGCVTVTKADRPPRPHHRPSASTSRCPAARSGSATVTR